MYIHAGSNLFNHCVCDSVWCKVDVMLCDNVAGFMQDTDFARLIVLVDMWMLTHIYTSQLRCALLSGINYKHMCDTHCQGMTVNSYGL